MALTESVGDISNFDFQLDIIHIPRGDSVSGGGLWSWPVGKETCMAEFQYAPESALLFCLQTLVKIYWDLMATSHVLLMSSLTNKFFTTDFGRDYCFYKFGITGAIKTANRRVNLILSNLY